MKKTIAFLIVFSFQLNCFSQEIRQNFSKEVKTKLEINYILDLPSNQKEKFPLLVFLHGSGERGTDLEIVKNHSPFTYKNLIKSPIAILAPQCPENVWWDTNAVYHLILEIASKYNVDKSRIYLTGLSMGGWGTWKLSQEHPDLFAAIATVCAPADRLMKIQADKLKNIPIKIYHGALDDIVTPDQSIEMYLELKKINPNTDLIIFSKDNHNSWDSTYSNPEFYKWLLEQHK